MTDEEAALLAELRAISNNSSSNKRFLGGDDDDVETEPVPPPEIVKSTQPNDDGSPSKRLSSPLAAEASAGQLISDLKVMLNPRSSDLSHHGMDRRDESSAGIGSSTSLRNSPSSSLHLHAGKENPPSPGNSGSVSSLSNNEPRMNVYNLSSTTPGVSSSGPKTFKGDNGGEAADDDLLRELRAISAKSSSADRFLVDEQNAADALENTATISPVTNKPQIPVVRKERSTPKKANPRGEVVPPWKRQNRKKIAMDSQRATNMHDDNDMSNDSSNITEKEMNPTKAKMQATPPMGDGFSSGPKTFTGDRGGDAADDDLLAELRAISNKSSSVDRFAVDDENDDGAINNANNLPMSDNPPIAKQPKKPIQKKSFRPPGEVPPWKKSNKKSSAMKDESNTSGNTTSHESPPAKTALPKTTVPTPTPALSMSGGFSSGPKTFTGDRGGDAADDDLLAELRAISNKSSSVDRFAADDENDDGATSNANNLPMSDNPPIVKMPKKPVQKKSFRPPGEVPPWKKTTKKKHVVDSNVESSMMKNESNTSGNTTSHESPPAKTTLPKTTVPTPTPAPPMGGGFSSGPKTFAGDRGGDAADDDLLAELRAISNKSNSVDRFADDENDDGAISNANNLPMSDDPSIAKKPKKPIQKKSFRPPGEVPPWKKKNVNSVTTSTSAKPSTAVSSPTVRDTSNIVSSTSKQPSLSSSQIHVATKPMPNQQLSMTAPAEEELVITEESLVGALEEKNWKLRKAAYQFLSSTLSERVKSTGEMDINNLLPSLDSSLDSLIPSMVKESNAAALDASLSFLVLYADCCSNAGRAEQAFSITHQLCLGSGLCGRPSTIKLAKELVMKLMEVSQEGVSSVHSIVEVLLTDGLSSRKPKTVLNAVTLVLDACHAFGASSLPVDTIAQSAQKMLSHANGTVRDTSIHIIAEICRAVGSKDPLQAVLEIMKSAQLSQLDSLLEANSAPYQATVGFRHQDKKTGGDTNIAETLRLEAEKSRQEKFASRPSVNIFKLLPGTDYSSRIKEKKWSEKVGALDILLECGGQKPYKLEQPSPSIDYASLISEVKSLLSHTHFAVKSRSMAVISMLAEGVGPKLFPFLKPLIGDILEFAKDKKLTRYFPSCLDSMFGNIVGFENLLEKDDVLETILDEKKQKNALIRTAALDFLKRCVQRSETAGPRGTLNTNEAEKIIQLASQKLNDSDASVRNGATDLLKMMRDHNEKDIRDISCKAIQVLEETNPRLHKSLQSDTKSNGGSSDIPPKSSPKKNRSALPKRPEQKKKPTLQKKVPLKASSKKQVKNSQTKQNSSDILADCEEGHVPPFEDAMAALTSLNIPNWDEDEDEGGIVSGIKASNWKFRKEAIDQIADFTKSSDAVSLGTTYPSNIIVFLRDNSREFKESNFNILKSIMEVFIVICDFCTSIERLLEIWICRAAVMIAIGKLSDKKLSDISSQLLTCLCEVQSPEVIFALCMKGLETMKSPLPREGFLLWSKTFCSDFGADALGRGISSFATWALNECASTNIRLRRASISVIGEIHTQVGPMLKALVNSNGNIEETVKVLVEKELELHPFNPSLSSESRKKKGPTIKNSSSLSSGTKSDDFAIPKIDFVASLPDNCMEHLTIKEGKDAWKKRKAALEDVEVACGQYKCLISTTPSCMKSLINLFRALRLRLNDSQSNLKPLAARNIASLLNAVDGLAQAKLGKLIYAPLINAAMNDNKKPMREAAIEALKIGTTKMDTEGGEVNPAAMDSFIAAMISELNDGFKSIGLPQVLDLIIDRAKFFPPIESINSAKAASLEAQFTSLMVSCVVSSKAEARSKAELVLKECVKYETVNYQSIEKAVSKLNPAEQKVARNVMPSANMSTSTSTLSKESTPKRNRVSRKTRQDGRKSLTRQRSISQTRSVSSRNGKDSMSSSSKNSSSLNNILSDSSINPLKSINGSGPSKSNRLSMSRMRDNWPEYPEEPSGKDIFTSLKKSWGVHLPASSIQFLFPDTGIKKQEDASKGCELLSHSLSIVVEDEEDTTFINQLDFVNKWLAYAICSRESTVGMQTLISFLLEMFSFLRQKHYQMSDSESTILLPFLLEKAGGAKGRFREMLHDMLSTISTDEIIPLSTYGSVICVSVMDRSSTAKSRALAARECKRCVEKCGLNAIGKKGIQVTARGISEEHIAENKAALLDLIEEIVKKMNGDVQRYIKVCGNSNLSNRAKQTIETRLNKLDKSNLIKRSSKRTNSRSRSSSRMSINSARNPKDTPTSNTTKRMSSQSPAKRASHYEDEVPSLNLKLDEFEESNTEEEPFIQNGNQEGPFTFSFSTRATQRNESVEEPANVAYTNTSDKKLMLRSKEDDESTTNEPTSSAAASLRARLKQLRNKHKSTENEDAQPSFNAQYASPTDDRDVFSDIFKDIEQLLSQPTPLVDPDSNVSALVGLRKIHSSLASTPSATEDAYVLQELRTSIKVNVSFCVERLSNVLDFGFRSGSQTSNEGLSIPLLSVTIAALMAIFMDSELSGLVSEDALSKVIQQSTFSLLDRRLAGSSEYEHILDASTCKKMVKAINKLAIQATYGAKRHISLQSLYSLQVKFCESSVREEISSTDVSNTNNRMSRIITKLFSRVLKAEEGNVTPFSSSGVDLSAIFSSIDKVLEKCYSVHSSHSNIVSTDPLIAELVKDERMVPCFTMAKTLMLHILKVKQDQDEVDDVKVLLRNCGLLENQFTGSLFSACCREIGVDKTPHETKTESLHVKESDSKDISQLLLDVGNAESDGDRSQALQELKVFLASNRNVDLGTHLSRLSEPFRRYIQNELQSQSSSRSLLSGYSSSRNSFSNLSFESEMSKSTISMSEKLRYLKSKINAAEATAQAAIIPNSDTQKSPPSVSSTTQRSLSLANNDVPNSPNKISSLRQRLAAASERRSSTNSISSNSMRSSDSLEAKKSIELGAVGGAATLRARLESVKRMNTASRANKAT